MIILTFDSEQLNKIIQNAVRSVISENQISPAVTPNGQQLLTRKEAADLVGVCLATVDNKVKSGVLKKYRTGGIVRFRHQEVVEAFTQSLFDNSKRAATARSKKS